MYKIREMVEIDAGNGGGGASSQQISGMFQKFWTKTYEQLFADDDENNDNSNNNNDSDDDVDGDLSLLLDSTDELITDQKVVVIKPDSSFSNSPEMQLVKTLIPSLFATISSLEASYLQFQAAHVPQIDQNALHLADKLIVSNLNKLTETRNLYRDCCKGNNSSSNPNFEFPATSFLEFQVQENQNKLRALETIVNSLQSQIDAKAEEVRVLRAKRDKIEVLNGDLSRKLVLIEGNRGLEVLLTVRVFEAMLGDSVRSFRSFAKLLIHLMERAGWDLEEAARSVYQGVDYAKKGHFRYVFLSFVSLRMCQDFDKSDFGLRSGGEIEENGGGEGNGYLRKLIEHVACNPMEMLRKDPKCEFSQFCERKYEELIHPKMESSIFCNFDSKEEVLDSWKSLGVFYESFVRMASSVWLLHKLAYSFSPAVEIFQVEREAEFSMVYMEDVLGKGSLVGKDARPRVDFTVVPGFKVGRTVVQSQVYLTRLKSKD